MSGEFARKRPVRATAAVCAIALSLAWCAAGMVRADGPPGDTWFGTPLNAFSGAAVGDESFWFSASYMVTQRSGYDLPPLVTSNPPGTTVDIGRLDNPSTTVLAGDLTTGDDWRSGVLLEGGLWINALTGTALIGDYFNGGSDSYGFYSREDTILALPFLSAGFNTPDVQDAFAINIPGDRAGAVSLKTYEDFHSAGGAIQTCLWSSPHPCLRCDGAMLTVFGGYRYYHNDSGVLLDTNTTVVPDDDDGAPGPGDDDPDNDDDLAGIPFVVRNSFVAQNDFHGAEFGLSGRVQNGDWWADGVFGLAIGGNRKKAYINGRSSNEFDFGNSVPGGNYVSEVTNLGKFVRTETTVIPRFRLGLGCNLTEHLSARLGYNLIIWDGVAEAADTLPPDMAVDIANLPLPVGGGPDPRPPQLKGTTMVSHGLELGLEFWF